MTVFRWIADDTSDPILSGGTYAPSGTQVDAAFSFVVINGLGEGWMKEIADENHEHGNPQYHHTDPIPLLVVRRHADDGVEFGGSHAGTNAS